MIRQGRVSESVKTFDFLGKFNLNRYNDINKPCIFFGCYVYRNDHKIILNRNSLAVLVWRGSDITSVPKEIMKSNKSRKNIKHVAIGSFIKKDLEKLNIKYKYFPITSTIINPDPQPLGKYIYTYAPNKFYNKAFIDELSQTFKIYNNERNMTKEQEYEALLNSFIGLRLTPHDGLPNTVIKLGLMGRKCIYNGILPNAISYKNKEEVINIIKKESKAIGQTNISLAYSMANFLHDDLIWLNEKIWT